MVVKYIGIKVKKQIKEQIRSFSSILKINEVVLHYRFQDLVKFIIKPNDHRGGIEVKLIIYPILFKI